MSSIEFATRNDSRYIRGSERAHMSWLVDRALRGFLPGNAKDIGRFIEGSSFETALVGLIQSERQLDREQQYGKRADIERQLQNTLALYVSTGVGEPTITLDGLKLEMWSIALNTVLAIGSPPMQLAAKIHGTCEIHGWIAGKNRDWLAGVIEQGLKAKLFRTEMGWEALIEFLRESKRCNVVMSYSVCDSYDFKKGRMEENMEISPESLGGCMFMGEKTIFDCWQSIHAANRKERAEAI